MTDNPDYSESGPPQQRGFRERLIGAVTIGMEEDVSTVGGKHRTTIESAIGGESTHHSRGDFDDEQIAPTVDESRKDNPSPVR